MAIIKCIKCGNDTVVETPILGELRVNEVLNTEYRKLFYYLRGLDPSVQIFISRDNGVDISSVYVFSDKLVKAEIDEVASKLLPTEYSGGDSDFLTFCYTFKDLREVPTEFLYSLIY